MYTKLWASPGIDPLVSPLPPPQAPGKHLSQPASKKNMLMLYVNALNTLCC